MKKWFLPAMGVLILLIASCQSKPKPPEASPSPSPTATPAPTPSPEPTPAPTPEPSSEPSLKASDFEELDAKAEGLRKDCVEYGFNDSAADEYQAAYGLLEDARAAVAAGDAEQAVSLYEGAISSFENIISSGNYALAMELRDTADQMREAAVEQDAEYSSPDQLAGADAAYEEGGTAMTGGDFAEAAAAYRKAVARYEIVYDRSKAVKARDQVDTYGFKEADPGNYELASVKLDESDALFESDERSSLDAVQEAELRFNIVLRSGWELGLGRVRGEVDDGRAQADKAKADRAVPEMYAEADALSQEAYAMEAEERYAEAEETYQRAVEAFIAAAGAAEQKRADADKVMEAMLRAKERSRQLAEQGDQLMQAGAEGKEAAE